MADAKGLAKASAEQVRQINAAQAAWDARWPEIQAMQQAMRTELARRRVRPRRRWSWWRFTLTVR